MAKKMNLTMFIFITLLFSTNLKAGELTFGWNKINETGNINDMQFMPGHDQFIFCTSFDMQIRNTETGELVQSYPFGAFDIEFTPDSTRLIMLAVGGTTGRIEIRNVSDMSLIKEYIIPESTDTAGYDIQESSIGFTEMVVDPVRPYIYAVRWRSGTLEDTKYFSIRKIVIINYETMEEVGVLPNSNGDNLWLEKIAISKDGKYLAVNNGGESYLRVWSLDTRQEIRSYKICDYISVNGGQPSCTKFSEINTDIIYFAGEFPQVNSDNGFSGILCYSIQENKIIDSTFAIVPNFVYQGYFTLLDNEERAIKIDLKILILNLKNKTIEQKIDQDTIKNGPAYWAEKLLYSRQKDYLVGFSTQYYSFGKYTTITGTEDPIHFDSIIYPNPNTGLVTLTSNCQNPMQSYDVLNINGSIIIPITIINSQTGNITIDISTLPEGTYLLMHHCSSSVTTYKIIKED